MSSGQAPGKNGRPPGPGVGQQGIAAAITEVTERASVLIREEIELAKTEITEKTTRLAKGAIVGIVAGVFFFTALFFVLIGCAWLLYYELPIGNEFTYFWGFFAMAVILVVLGVIAGLLAYKAVKAGAPTPDMAIEEARKIRETVSSSSSDAQRAPAVVTPTGSSASSSTSATVAAAAAPTKAPPSPTAKTAARAQGTQQSAQPKSGAETGNDGDLGRGTIDGTTLGG